MTADPRIAVFIPCLDEEQTIGKVVDDFRRELPDAAIFVIDNGSTDRTAQIAEEHGARVVSELARARARRADGVPPDRRRHPDHGRRRRHVPAEAVGALLQPVLDGRADMTVGSRLMSGTSSDFGPLNRLGNWIYPTLLRFLLRTRLTDVLSGFRVMTREFVRASRSPAPASRSRRS